MSDEIGAEILKAVEAKHGSVAAEYLVEDARDESHPWHDRFDWDDKTAGHRWRIVQARQLIRSVGYRVIVHEAVVRSVAYVRDPDAKPGVQGYVAVSKLRSDKERAKDALAYELQRIESNLSRVSDLLSVLELGEEFQPAMQRLRDTVADMESRVGQL